MGLLLMSLYYQAYKELNTSKLICAILYTSSCVAFIIATNIGSDTMLDISFALYLITNFAFFRLYYDFMNPHIKANEELWKMRKYSLWN